MSFQDYLILIDPMTRKTLADFRTYAAEEGRTAGGTFAARITDLKANFGLGHGHEMAIATLWKGLKQEG